MPSRSRIITDAHGNVVAIACSREPHRSCSTPGCNRHADKQCDYPVTRKGRVGTCDRYLCSACAVRVGPDRDYCRPHARVAEKKP